MKESETKETIESKEHLKFFIYLFICPLLAGLYVFKFYGLFLLALHQAKFVYLLSESLLAGSLLLLSSIPLVLTHYFSSNIIKPIARAHRFLAAIAYIPFGLFIAHSLFLLLFGVISPKLRSGLSLEPEENFEAKIALSEYFIEIIFISIIASFVIFLGILYRISLRKMRLRPPPRSKPLQEVEIEPG